MTKNFRFRNQQRSQDHFLTSTSPKHLASNKDRSNRFAGEGVYVVVVMQKSTGQIHMTFDLQIFKTLTYSKKITIPTR